MQPSAQEPTAADHHADEDNPSSRPAVAHRPPEWQEDGRESGQQHPRAFARLVGRRKMRHRSEERGQQGEQPTSVGHGKMIDDEAGKAPRQQAAAPPTRYGHGVVPVRRIIIQPAIHDESLHGRGGEAHRGKPQQSGATDRQNPKRTAYHRQEHHGASRRRRTKRVGGFPRLDIGGLIELEISRRTARGPIVKGRNAHGDDVLARSHRRLGHIEQHVEPPRLFFVPAVARHAVAGQQSAIPK